MERVSKRIGRLVLGDTPLSPIMQATGAGRGSAQASAGMEEHQALQTAAQGPIGFEPRSYGGVPVADKPRQKQIGCETCGQSFEPHHARIKCHVCCLWIHDDCVETLSIGDNWCAEMCLACQQRSTRKLRVIKALELRKGNRWDADKWFQAFRQEVTNGGEYGVSRNRDLNELESTLAKAILNGLHYYVERPVIDSTTDGDEQDDQQAEDPPQEEAPPVEAEVPRPKDLPPGPGGSGYPPPPPPPVAAENKGKS